MSQKKTKLPNLEKSLEEISQLIENMEEGELNLEKSLASFERGVTLVKHCQSILNTAEQKVQLLIEKNGKDILSDYESIEEEESDDEDE